MSTKNAILLTAIILITLSGCQRLYWQRNKVRTGNKSYQSMEVYIENKVPYIFNLDFDAKLKNTCKTEFERMGYTFNYKDTPDFITVIKINMDSFATSGVYTFGAGGPTSFWKTYKRNNVRAILFDYTITSTKYNTVKWANKNDIFYFYDAYRNSQRSMNMIKYTIRYGK